MTWCSDDTPDSDQASRPEKMSRSQRASSSSRSYSPIITSKGVEIDIDVLRNNGDGRRSSSDDEGNMPCHDELIVESIDSSASADDAHRKSRRTPWKLVLVGVAFMAASCCVGFGVFYLVNYSLFPPSNSTSSAELSAAEWESLSTLDTSGGNNTITSSSEVSGLDSGSSSTSVTLDENYNTTSAVLSEMDSEASSTSNPSVVEWPKMDSESLSVDNGTLTTVTERPEYSMPSYVDALDEEDERPEYTMPSYANAFHNGDHDVPTTRPLNATTSSSNPTSISFYVMADAPYSDYERTDIMPQQIEGLDNNDGAAFLVHLGDLQKVRVDECSEYAYTSATEILRKSALPVFVLPGDNDINDCPTLEHGEAMWREYYYKFDELYWEHDFEMARWGTLDESFAFLHNGILFIGLNIIGGTPTSWKEWRTRHALHLRKVKAIMTSHAEDFSIAVLLGHATPSRFHEDFFLGQHGIAKFVEEMDKPFLHLHGDLHEWSEWEGAFDVDNYMMVSLDQGENAPPIRVEIDTSKANPIKIDRMESGLVVECCSDGWPRLEGTVNDWKQYDGDIEGDDYYGGDDDDKTV